jgi:hypothetical protein
VTVCAVYFSQFTPRLMAFNLGPTFWRAAATVGLAWVVLAGFYYYHRLFKTLAAHCLVPAGIATLLIGDRPGSSAWWHGLATLLICAGFFVNVLCFPFAVLAMVTRWLERPRTMAATTTPVEVESPEERSEEPRTHAVQYEPPGEAGQ